MNEFLTGEAGTGKTTLLKSRCALPNYGMMVATTGIAAVNLGTQTLASLLKFYDTASMARHAHTGKLQRVLGGLVDTGVLGSHLCIDEASMLEAAQLDLLHAAVNYVCPDVSIVLTGDFAQLPPVSGEFAFKAACWPEFERNITRLTENFRQEGDVQFLRACNLIRKGNTEGVVALMVAGASFERNVDTAFGGMTLFPTNDEADRMNGMRFARLAGAPQIYVTTRKGKQAMDWTDIPDATMLKVGTRVMITANEPATLAYANGDLGTIVSLRGEEIDVALDRHVSLVTVGKVTRRNFDYRGHAAKYLGEITYLPVKLGYALTIHKAQGLTLGSVQVVTNHWFAGSPALMYVAISRARRARDVRIVGTPADLATKIKAHPDAERWL